MMPWVSGLAAGFPLALDRKSTRLNSSHLGISYAVFCLKKKMVSDQGADGAGSAGAAPARERHRKNTVRGALRRRAARAERRVTRAALAPSAARLRPDRDQSSIDALGRA